MKIGVTAASGHLGEAIIRELMTVPGIEVIGFARTPERAAHLGIEIREGDYEQKEHFSAGLQDIDRLLLVSSNADPEERIYQHRNIIDAAIGQGVSKLVYTSIQGSPLETDFAPYVAASRVTEEYIDTVFDNYAIGRNGLYLEADLDYIQRYIDDDGIYNCAGSGKCSYTLRSELAIAYKHLILEDKFYNVIVNLGSNGYTQADLAAEINRMMGSNIGYHSETVAQYLSDRIVDIGDELGRLIAGIYDSISRDHFNAPSDFEMVVGRKHKSLSDMMEYYLNQNVMRAA